MKRTTKWIIGVIFVVSFVIGYPTIFAWSPLWCWHEEIGLDTARMRKTTYLFWVQVSARDEPTLLSETLQIPRTSMESRWVAVNTFSPGVRYSPHYNLHCAPAQISALKTCWLRTHFSPEAKRLTAQALLDRWRLGSGYHAADKLLKLLEEYSYDHAVGSTISDDEVKQLIRRS